MFPVLLDLTDRRTVVIGGGAVGARKVSALLAVGAAVCVVDPRGALTLPPEVVHIGEAYRAEHLEGAAVAFACATPEVNAQVVVDAKKRGVWVNAASSPHEGDFTLPAVVRRGEFTLAVNTGGASPALARRVRERLEAEYDAAFGEWVRVLAELRAEVLARVPDEARRRELLDGFADWSWLERLRTEGVGPVREAMLARL
ncbi:Precorrin-2 dehydrogenase [Gemmata obscuriglobus]|uniref:precorrin-2 dehydrogenase/sirohydrochlorin ferrochelatase family protein n=1 Tax=Gemmata obscuriglobus TaxID=114 RepID=UPI00016C4502|nr:bifunctional precorrin-2 dehydrogenase/sirohydrochlorin ferrochelatase [Gemmata obscuriglobus]QEG25474.1 Precorrin-2 dehydrogenase [Gemmata obscuriglobus]VTR98687.1 siroheme synthase : Siroheme synthase OS=planctomycete KSU-1 GN=KSU1_D0614 PE=4 SV=1: NAD_binding_7 [Gemmata obscuriglobus UQM 2246]